jgi:3-methyladenine DNA glycosylase AlkD
LAFGVILPQQTSKSRRTYREEKMMDKKATPEEIAKRALVRLKAKADPVRAAATRKYFKEAAKFYGLVSADVRDMAAEFYDEVREDWGWEDAVALCEILYREPHLEAKSIGTLVLFRFRKTLPESMFTKIKGWLAADLLDNWASVDGLCPDVMGTLIVRYPALSEKIKAWTRHPGRWVKRASAVSFIKLARKPEYRDTVESITESLFPVDDDLIQKANGWLLREFGKGDMGRLEKFLLKHGPAIPRTTLRYAIERFDEKKRKALLSATKA